MASYSDVMRVLAALYGADEKIVRGPLRGRIQNLQKLGIPLELHVGKGKKIDYKRDEIYQIVLCMELAEIGVTPSAICYIVTRWWHMMSQLFFMEMQSLSAGVDKDNLLVFSMNQISSAWDKDSGFVMGSAREEADLLAALKGLSNKRHLCLINVSKVVRDVEKQLALVVPQQED